MNIAGIDVGFTGAIAIMNDVGKIIDVFDMPIVGTDQHELDEVAIVEALKDWTTEHVFIEKAQSMPGQGIASTGRYMCGYGILRGICAGLQIPYTLVRPATWKKEMMQDMGKEKGQSIIRCNQLFPYIKLPRKKDHGKADAMLIAAWGYRHL
jgi:crossover junction endodeoxyribonuclease RuvC